MSEATSPRTAHAANFTRYVVHDKKFLIIMIVLAIISSFSVVVRPTAYAAINVTSRFIDASHNTLVVIVNDKTLVLEHHHSIQSLNFAAA